MKQFAIIISLFFFTCTFAQKNKDVVGFYISNDKTSIFKFYKSGDKYVGKLVWMKHPERKDTMNPDVSKRNKKLLGSIVVYGLIYDGKNEWTEGFVYDATKGKTFQCHICRDEKNNITMRGYIGIPALGKSEYFVKVNFKE
ncbi:MAG TPA: DUF2147 domain-containing protein [Bacteroidia bacterium]|jgi:uncharacterized protein (DUF2147 family)|nr:DUF2147 domain-containing protein [Bacteroidia bacterium]